jgi:hypothetical protein
MWKRRFTADDLVCGLPSKSAESETTKRIRLYGLVRPLIQPQQLADVVEKSNLLHCSQDGAQIGSFGVTLHDNWFGENGRNGATFVDSSVTDELGQHFAGFCASCFGNAYWHNTAHGLVYNVTGIADARHVGDYVDSNGDVGMVVHGVRDFTFNSGWIGSNQVGGAVIDDTQIGTDIVENTFTTNFGPNLVVTETSGPLHVSGNVSSLPQNPCDARINGTCIDMNTL